MADRYENDLVTREDVNDINVDTDYIRTLDENGVSYKDNMADIAKVFIEDYDNTPLGGAPRSVKYALDIMRTDLDTAATSITDRTCTTAELATLKTRLDIE